MEVLVEVVGKNILPFLANLEWIYIITFILICYNYQLVEKAINIAFLTAMKTRFKVALIGILYAPLYYLLGGLSTGDIGNLFSSFLVSFTFHKLLVDILINSLSKHAQKAKFKEAGGSDV